MAAKFKVRVYVPSEESAAAGPAVLVPEKQATAAAKDAPGEEVEMHRALQEVQGMLMAAWRARDDAQHEVQRLRGTTSQAVKPVKMCPPMLQLHSQPSHSPISPQRSHHALALPSLDDGAVQRQLSTSSVSTTTSSKRLAVELPLSPFSPSSQSATSDSFLSEHASKVHRYSRQNGATHDGVNGAANGSKENQAIVKHVGWMTGGIGSHAISSTEHTAPASLGTGMPSTHAVRLDASRTATRQWDSSAAAIQAQATLQRSDNSPARFNLIPARTSPRTSLFDQTPTPEREQLPNPWNNYQNAAAMFEADNANGQDSMLYIYT